MRIVPLFILAIIDSIIKCPSDVKAGQQLVPVPASRLGDVQWEGSPLLRHVMFRSI